MTTTKVFARFYCLDNTGKNRYLSYIKGNVPGTGENLAEDDEFSESLLQSFLITLPFLKVEHNFEFDYDEKKTIIGCKFRTTDSHILSVIFWLGNREPRCRIGKWIYLVPGAPNKRKTKVQRPTICFTLGVESLVYLGSPTISEVIINKYLEVCTEEQYQQLVSEEYMLRYCIYQDKHESAPYCYVSNIEKKTLSNIYTKTMEECPKDGILCENIDHNVAHFIYIPRTAITEKGSLKREDIIKVD
jgi:hypothetical protein